MPLKGNLRDFNLPDLFQLIRFGKKSGTLVLSKSDARGYICFRNGNIYFATHTYRRPLLGQLLIRLNLITEGMLEEALDAQKTTRRGERLGNILVEMGYIRRDALESIVQDQIKEAVFNLLLWSEGEFEFDRTMTFPQEDIGLSVSTEDLMIENERRMQEWDQIEKNVPSLDTVFQMTQAPGREDVEINLTSNEWLVLYQVDGISTVMDIILNSQQSALETCRALSGLVSTGMIEIREFKQVEGMPKNAGSLREQVAMLEREGAGRYTAPVEDVAGDEFPAGGASVDVEKPREKEEVETASAKEAFTKEEETVEEPAGALERTDSEKISGEEGSAIQEKVPVEAEKEYAGDDLVLEEKGTEGADESLVDYYKKLALEEAANSEKLILFIESEQKRTHESSEFSGIDIYKSEKEQVIGAETSPDEIPDFDEPESIPLEWSGHIARLRGFKERGAESLRKKINKLHVEQPVPDTEEKEPVVESGTEPEIIQAEEGALEAEETLEAKDIGEAQGIPAGSPVGVFEEESAEEALEDEEIISPGAMKPRDTLEIVFEDEAFTEAADSIPPVYEEPQVGTEEQREAVILEGKPPEYVEETSTEERIFAEAPPEYIEEKVERAETGEKEEFEGEIFIGEQKEEAEKLEETSGFEPAQEIRAQIEVEAESEFEPEIITVEEAARDEIASPGLGVEIEKSKKVESEKYLAGAGEKPGGFVEEVKPAPVEEIEIEPAGEHALEAEEVEKLETPPLDDKEGVARAQVVEQEILAQEGVPLAGNGEQETPEIGQESLLEEEAREEKKSGFLGRVLRFGKKRALEKHEEEEKEVFPSVLWDEETQVREEAQITGVEAPSTTESAEKSETAMEAEIPEIPAEVSERESEELQEVTTPSDELSFFETDVEAEYPHPVEKEEIIASGAEGLEPEAEILPEFEETSAGSGDFEKVEVAEEDGAREPTESMERAPVTEEITPPHEEILQVHGPLLSKEDIINRKKEEAEVISFAEAEETPGTQTEAILEGISSAPSGGEVVETGVVSSGEADVEEIEIEGLTEGIAPIPGVQESRASLEFAFELDVAHISEVSVEETPAFEGKAEEVSSLEELAPPLVEQTASFEPVEQQTVRFEFDKEPRKIENFQGFELAANAHSEAPELDESPRQEEEKVEFGEVVPLVQAEEPHDAHAPVIDFDTGLPLRIRRKIDKVEDMSEREISPLDQKATISAPEARIQAPQLPEPLEEGESIMHAKGRTAATVGTGEALEKGAPPGEEHTQKFVAEIEEEAAAQREDESALRVSSADISKSLHALGENLPILDEETEVVKSGLALGAEGEEEDFLGGVTVMGKREKGTCLVDLETLELERELLEFARLAKGKKKEPVEPEESRERGGRTGQRRTGAKGKTLKDSSGVMKHQKSQSDKGKTGDRKEKQPDRKIIKKIIDDLKKL